MCRDGKAVSISHKGNKEHKERVADLVDNKLLDEQDRVVTRVPAIARHELQPDACTFVVLASAGLIKARTPQQVVDAVSAALKVWCARSAGYWSVLVYSRGSRG